MNKDYQEAHKEAYQRFINDPTKCYQRHIREVWAKRENRNPIESLKGAQVRQITRKEAESIILKYEWLAVNPLNKAPMGFGIKAYYGLFLNDELLGANCLGTVSITKRTGSGSANICGVETVEKTVSIARGACVPHAPKNAASFFITHTCRQAYKDFGWQIFVAYSDHDAGEIGTVYQAANWYYLGVGPGSGKHYNYLSPDGKKLVKSYQLNHDKDKKFVKSLGWTESLGVPMRQFLRSKGWTQIVEKPKGKWVWFEGTKEDRIKLLQLAKNLRGYKPLPYPKRGSNGEMDRPE